MESSRFASSVLDNLPAALTPVNSIVVNGLVLRQFWYWGRPLGSTEGRTRVRSVYQEP